MKNILKNYKETIILLVSIIIGGVIGLVFGSKAKILSPLGDIFINLMFVVIVPLVFLTITSSIIKMKSPKRLGKIMSRIVIIFVIMSIISALLGIASCCITKLVDNNDTENIMNLMNEEEVIEIDMNI